MRVVRSLFWSLAMVAAFFAVIRLAPVHSISGPVWEGPASAASAYTTDEQNNIDVYKGSRDATVNITSKQYQRDWFFQVYPQEGAGSGFIVNPDGLIVTNNHVVKGLDVQLSVTLSDKKTLKASVVGYDAEHDLALVKIDAGRRLPFLRLGDSDNLQVGQKVLAIGNPFEFGGTLTTGIVSSLDRSITTEDNRPLEGMIQTDAAINPGNSGGPLLNSHGDVIGINTAIFGQQNVGIGFATPINRVKGLLDQFEKTGHVAPPWLGVQTVYISQDLADMLQLPRKGGLLVQQIERGSPAQEYGLHGARQIAYIGNYGLGIGGDLIQAIDGQPVTGKDDLKHIMDKKRAGDNVALTIYRNGSTDRITVKLAEAPDR